MILFSFLFLRRTIFPLCVYIIIIKTIKKNILSLKILKVIEYIKINKVEINEDNDAYLEKNKIVNQLMMKNILKLIEKEKSIPR